MTTAVELYVTFNVMKLHFNGNYDIRRYGFNNKRFTQHTMEKEHTDHLYMSYANEFGSLEKAKTCFAANLVRDTKLFPTNIDLDAGKTLAKYNKNKNILLDDFKDELRSGLLTTIKNGDIIDTLITNTVSIELIAFVNRFIPLVKLIDASAQHKLMWNLIKHRIEKYELFCTINTLEERDAIKTLLLRTITENLAT